MNEIIRVKTNYDEVHIYKDQIVGITKTNFGIQIFVKNGTIQLDVEEGERDVIFEQLKDEFLENVGIKTIDGDNYENN